MDLFFALSESFPTFRRCNNALYNNFYSYTKTLHECNTSIDYGNIPNRNQIREKDFKEVFDKSNDTEDTMSDSLENKIYFIQNEVKEKKPEEDCKKQEDFAYEMLEYQSNLDCCPNVEIAGKKEEKEEKKTTFLGRKRKDDPSEREHDKFSDGNIIIKIKTQVFNSYTISLIKNNSLDKANPIQLCKLRDIYMKNINTIYNRELLNTEIKEIYKSHDMSTKYTTLGKDYHKKLIEKIYNENKEKKVMKILDLKFKEILILFAKRLENEENEEKYYQMKEKDKEIETLEIYEDDALDLLKRIRTNDKDMDNLEDYIKKVKKKCLEYEDWFLERNERPSKKG